MRLGDLDALKEAIEEVKDNYDGYEPNDLGKFMNQVDDLIDNAPPVNTNVVADNVITAHENIGYEQGFNDGYAKCVTDNERPQGDCISREALKADLRQYFTDGVLNGVSAKLAFNQILHDIDNAPTVEPRDNFDLGYVKGLEDGRNEKPKVVSDHFVSYTRTCHICGYLLATYNPEDYKFCPRCGMEFGV